MFIRSSVQFTQWSITNTIFRGIKSINSPIILLPKSFFYIDHRSNSGGTEQQWLLIEASSEKDEEVRFENTPEKKKRKENTSEIIEAHSSRKQVPLRFKNSSREVSFFEQVIQEISSPVELQNKVSHEFLFKLKLLALKSQNTWVMIVYMVFGYQFLVFRF